MAQLDAIVVGSGPNGLAAAVTLARAGLSVRVYERLSYIGGGASTRELTLPGFQHDVCSAVHPMALASQFFRQFALADRVEFAVPEISYGHPLPGGDAGIAYHDIVRTADALGRDGDAWLDFFAPLLANAKAILDLTGNQLLRIPRHPVGALAFGLRVLEQGSPAWNARFTHEVAPALLTGVFAHTIRPMPRLAPAGAGITLATLGHTVGWPIPIGGSGAIMQALADDFEAHGGEIVTDSEVTSLAELPPAHAVLLDTTPRALVRLAGDALPAAYERALGRFKYGNGVAKVDFALSDPVPWANETLREAPTVHVGGTRAQLARAENAVARGEYAEDPYVLVSQPTLVDPSRAPEGKHVLWAYTHVPAGSTLDQTEAITRQLERYAPGFRDTVLASSSRTALDMQQYNPNYVGGDIAAGEVSMLQLVKRPVISRNPWRTPIAGVYLCSASTPPGPGVTGMNGWRAALTALRDRFGISDPPSLAPEADAAVSGA